MHFKGQLKVPGEVGDGIPVDLHLDDIFVALSSETGQLGRWRMDEVGIERLESNRFTLRLAEEELVFVADDALGFAYEGVVAVEEIAGRLRKKRRGRRGQRGRRAKREAAPVASALAEAPEAVPQDEAPLAEPPEIPAPERRPTPPPLPSPAATADSVPESLPRGPEGAGEVEGVPPADAAPSRSEPSSTPGPGSTEPAAAPSEPARLLEEDDAEVLDPWSSSYAVEAVTVRIGEEDSGGAGAGSSDDLVYARVPPTSDAPRRPARPGQHERAAAPRSQEESDVAPVGPDTEEPAGPPVEEPVVAKQLPVIGEETSGGREPVEEPGVPEVPLPVASEEAGGREPVEEPVVPEVPLPAASEEAGRREPVEEPVDRELIAAVQDLELPPIGEETIATEPPVVEPPAAERPPAAPAPALSPNGSQGSGRRGSLFSRRRKEVEPHEHVYTESRTAGGITRRVCECGHVSFSGEDVYQHWH